MPAGIRQIVSDYEDVDRSQPIKYSPKSKSFNVIWPRAIEKPEGGPS
jgi:hypothetical protein